MTAMTLPQILAGIEDAESKLGSRQAIHSPTIISENMYRLGQYTSALEKILGDCEQEYEVKWATAYKQATTGSMDEDGKLTKGLSATASEHKANIETAKDKGNIKRLTRYVSSSWRNQTGAMARINHIIAETKSGGV